MTFKEGARKFLGIKTEEELKQVKTPKEKFRNFVETLVFALIGALLIKTFLLESSRIPTGSMENTILVGDFVLVNKVIYGSTTPRNIPFTNITLPHFSFPAIREPKAKDVVVFDWPGYTNDLEPSEIMSYVKRLIGMPGDTVKIVNKVVFVNGKEFWRPPNIQYISPQTIPAGIANPRIFPPGAPWNEDNYGPLVVPKKGDVIHLTPENLEQWRTIIDREFGRRVVQLSGNLITIDGKPAGSYTLKKDYYFMMGDNRDNSLDSRFWGFVARDRVIGEAAIVYWSWNPEIPFSNFFDLLSSVRLNRIARIIH
ncbi:MAG: signal peptidase I [Ignavibacteria bacterium]|nr:signal peptidase I [Ignavibacteria bacterium]MCU7503058.1 signal peptidase I [Ignavibacteria bacterium]MCU7516522.1 signal peptidase I [Ignavibacteria bacterium]